MSTWAYMRVYGRICTCVKRRLCREEYPSEGPALDEVPKCLRSAFERKCPGDDRLDLARLEKPCQRRPGFCPSRCRLREHSEKLLMLARFQIKFVTSIVAFRLAA